MTERLARGTYVTGKLRNVEDCRQGWLDVYSASGEYARLIGGGVNAYIVEANNLMPVVNPPALRCARCHEPATASVPYGACEKQCGGLVEVAP